MARKPQSKLDPRKRYLQIALNSTLSEAQKIIFQLPKSERTIVEAGTPLIKRYGEHGIRQIVEWYQQHLWGINFDLQNVIPKDASPLVSFLLGRVAKHLPQQPQRRDQAIHAYVVADLKTMDRGEAEVDMAARAGASAAIALGTAPIETLNAFIDRCEEDGLDAMIDMMNVEYPLAILSKLKKRPLVVILHRGVDEEQFNKEKQIPLHEIRRIKGAYNIMVAIAGGDTIREVQRSIFNDADIVVIWKAVYQSTAETVGIVEGFLNEIK